MIEVDTELADLMDARARTYGLLARLFRVEVDAEALEQLQAMKFPTGTGNDLVDKGYRQLYGYLRDAWEDSLTELAIDFVRCFIGHGVNGYSAAYPYESVYTSERRLMMQEARAEVLQVFRENGLMRDKWTEGEDHIALELEFMQRMAYRTSESLRAAEDDAAAHQVEVQARFTQNHLVNWMPMLVADMQQFAKTDFYKGLGNLALGFVQEDSALLTELLDSVEAA